MRRVWLLLLIGLLPCLTFAQAPGDTVSVEVPADRNCSDFVSQQSAQGWYEAIKLITSIDDSHGLDSDGDGQPCEGLRWGKVEDLGDGYAIRYELTPTQFDCPTVESPFTIQALRAQVIVATTDSIPYRGPEGVWPRWECVHTISQIVSQ